MDNVVICRATSIVQKVAAEICAVPAAGGVVKYDAPRSRPVILELEQ